MCSQIIHCWNSLRTSSNLFQLLTRNSSQRHNIGQQFRNCSIQRGFQSCRLNALSARQFHTSCPRPVHPAVVVVLRPVARVLAALVGRAVRFWWRKLHPARKQAMRDHAVRYSLHYAGVVVVCSGGCVALYLQHRVRCPYTDKPRFMLFRPDQLAQFDDVIFREELESAGPALLEVNTPEVMAVLRVGNRIVQRHKDLANKNWQVAVIDSPEENCYCLSSGQIVMNTGMLRACANEHQLAAVLAHEMAHVLLQHQNIKLSQECLLDALLLPFTFLAWCLASSDLLSFLLSWLFQKTSSVSVILPYSRELETEADTVGLTIMALGCYDVREASAFWQRMHHSEQVRKMISGGGGGVDRASTDVITDWLSTHPSHHDRYKLLDYYMPAAVQWRETMQCPRLSPVDPREFLKTVHSVVQEDDAKNTLHRNTVINTNCERANKSSTMNTEVDAGSSAADYFTARPAAPCLVCKKGVADSAPSLTSSSNSDSCSCAAAEPEYITLPLGVHYEGDIDDQHETRKSLGDRTVYNDAAPTGSLTGLASETASRLLSSRAQIGGQRALVV